MDQPFAAGEKAERGELQTPLLDPEPMEGLIALVFDCWKLGSQMFSRRPMAAH